MVASLRDSHNYPRGAVAVDRGPKLRGKFMKRVAGLIAVAGLVIAAPAFAKEVAVTVGLNDEAVMNGSCPPETTVHFTGVITADAPAKVVYEWRRSDGVKKRDTVDFAAASTQSVSNDWVFKKRYTGWIQLFVVEPRHLLHVKTKKNFFSVSCG